MLMGKVDKSLLGGALALAATAGFFAGQLTERQAGTRIAASGAKRRSDQPRLDALIGLERGRGRSAEHPGEIPMRGWKDILIRTVKEFLDDEAPLVAAGVTFYSLLALFPGIGAFVALWGLFGDVGEAQRNLQSLTTILPGGAITVISDHMANVAAAHESGLSLAALGGLLLSIWSADGAMTALIVGVGIAYDEPDKRGFLKKKLVSLSFTAGFLVFALAAAAVTVIYPALKHHNGSDAALVFGAVAWPALFIILCGGLALLYRHGPSRDRAKWRWITWGSVVAAVIWLAASIGFSLYAANFGTYDKTYGPLGAVVGFMTWIWISSMVVLLGAELNSEIEHQTVKDSTVGRPRRRGRRGAKMADTVGEAQGS